MHACISKFYDLIIIIHLNLPKNLESRKQPNSSYHPSSFKVKLERDEGIPGEKSNDESYSNVYSLSAPQTNSTLTTKNITQSNL